MVHSAGVLVRERGVHGVGLREIVATPADLADPCSATFPTARLS
jgi:hypothetical protein